MCRNVYIKVPIESNNADRGCIPVFCCLDYYFVQD